LLCKLRWMRCRTVALAVPPSRGTVGGGTGAGSTLGGEFDRNDGAEGPDQAAKGTSEPPALTIMPQ
jgi:hypothetical protein